MHSLRTDSLAAGWIVMTTAAWVVPFAFAGVWSVPVAIATAAGLAAGAMVPRAWLAPSRAGRRARIRTFKQLVVFGDGMNRVLRRLGWSRPFPSTPQRMRSWLLWTRVTERIHWSWLLGSLAPIYAAFHAGRFGIGTYLVCANIPFNILPILLQRYTRARLVRMLETCERQAA